LCQGTSCVTDIPSTRRAKARFIAAAYRLIADELELKGLKASENRVWRLCSEQGLWSNHSKKRGISRGPSPPAHDDLVQRDFTASRANEFWIGDIERHEAFLNREGCKTPSTSLSQQVGGVGDSLPPGTRERMTSSLDKAGTGQHR
jgi:hypothetical protein